ncbi:hypothetical protein [Longitalea arenae]|uniref:hypothetical protein n=1 Tax=Longitalea arenae TaxID=2812558 RepID=UPI001967F3AC|nr:hypothetical protein [Longitalea arenae]
MRTCVLLLAGTMSNRSFANDGHTTPSIFTGTHFIRSLHSFDSLITVHSTAKVCACQILNLRSNNHHIMNAVVFAEKTNEAGQANFTKARIRLEREKRILRALFYNKIEVIGKTTAATDCNTLFQQLKKKKDNLLLYEVLDADVAVR